MIVLLVARRWEDQFMGFTVDVDGLAARFRWMRRWLKYPVFDVNVVIDGLDRHQAFEIVKAAWEPLAGKRSSWVYPTGPGPTIMSRGKDALDLVQQLAATLEGRGLSGWITAPTVDLGDPPRWPAIGQGLYMAHRMAVPVELGPFNPWGVPDPGWGVAEAATEHVMDRLIEWTLGSDHTGTAGFLPVTVTAEDARDVLEMVYEDNNHELLGWNADQTLMRRGVNRLDVGQTVWHDADPSLSVTERANGLTDLLREFAPDLILGVVQTTQFLRMDAHDNWLWRVSPHLWNQYVPDAFGIQLLPSATLNKAHDLSQWTIEEVTTDRYLLTAKDLHPWLDYTKPERLTGSYSPLPEPLTQARHDFGDMILTKEIRDANPLRPPK